MNAYVLATQAKAQQLVSIVDARQGYPLAGTDVGGGIHVPPAQSVTSTYFVPRKHPTLSEWAYISDAVSDAALAPQAASLGLPAAAVLDSTWQSQVGQGP